MITYELALKIKKAGYVQRQWRFAFHYLPDHKKNEQGEVMVAPWELAKELKENTVYIPDLLELIEACGDSFGSLARNGAFRKYTPHSDKWVAWKPNQMFSVSGATAEEAVINLWLELKKK